ncbi:hypothetical protein NEHOM01_2429, partial [Nematocida homosporus]|uniref:uncharacterized protein n=1 Tax=Nematocida homosporus TaxID=1912981 RepID=UPI00221E4593
MIQLRSRAQLPKIIWIYLGVTGVINVIYVTLVLIVSRVHLVESHVQTEDFQMVMSKECATIIFHAFIDVQNIFYLFLNGVISFFYLYLVQIFCKALRFLVLEIYIFKQGPYSLIVWGYMILAFVKVVNGLFWIGQAKVFLYKRTYVNSEGSVQASSYYSVYYMLQGCSITLLTQSLFQLFFNLYLEPCSTKNQINAAVSAGITFLSWHFLWLEKGYMKNKQTVYILNALNLCRFIFIFLISGERRYFLNLVHRGKTPLEKLQGIFFPWKEDKN